MAFREAIDRYFGITASGSSFSTEIRGGIVVFMAMIYIITVNSLMMSHAGVDREVAVTTTTVMASLGCALMALYARFPVAMAPTMGVNAFVVYSMVLGSGYTWHEALVAVLISGVAFFLISISGLRGRLITAIPTGLRLGIVTALGLFIVFVGLQNSQLIVASDTLVALGDLSDPPVLLAMFCILSTLVFTTRWKNMGVLIGMAVSVVIGLVFGILEPPAQLVSMPVAPDLLGFAEGLDAGLLNTEFILMTMSLTLVQFFDTTGTLMGVGLRAGKTDEECERAMIADSAMSIVSGLMGSTPTGSYMESTIGIECGARTGFSSLVVALLFAVALFLGPLFGMIGYSCTVGAMVMVGVAMMTELRSVEWNDSAASCSVLMTVAFTILAYSIATGMCMGVVTYCLVMFASGRRNEIDGFMYILLALCAAYLLMTALT
ncbi:MAG: NCS2 family permease [Candidatus Methanomethylophilaceae archaeon]|nr:NCS2 family permease [Candidatus Methanomethylophilaceae archaeon]